jgi:SPP1 gp7 family putative phage head morphogenesis protein
VADSVNDRIADRERINVVDLLRYDTTLRRRAIGALRAIERNLVSRLVLADISGEGGPTAWRRNQMRELLVETRKVIATGYDDWSNELQDEMMGLAEVEALRTANVVNAEIGVVALRPKITDAMLRSIVSDTLIEGAPSREWWGRQAGDLQERFTRQMREGLVAGETNAELIRRVRGTRAEGFNDGIMQTSRRQAEALVRSSVMAVANEASMRVYDANDDVVSALVHVSTLDSRTTPICVARSGKRWKVGSHEPIGHSLPFRRPPVHWRCRSTLVPQLKPLRELGIDADEIPEGTRASIDGQVPGDISFDAWLKGKPVAFQNQLLGVGKAELWRRGRIGLNDLIDQSDRPRTLAELRALANAPGGASPPPPAPAPAPAPPTTRQPRPPGQPAPRRPPTRTPRPPAPAPAPGARPATQFTHDDFDKAGIERSLGQGEDPAVTKFWNERIRMAPAEFKRRFLPDADIRDSLEGFTIRYSNSTDTLNVAAVARGGELKIIRQIGRTNVHNDYFVVPDNLQKGGIAKRMLASQFEMWREMGVKSVDLFANLSVGGYAWAKYGFEPEPRAWTVLADTIRKRVNNPSMEISAASREIITKALASKNPRAVWAIADLPEGKKLLLGTNWDGIMKMDDAAQTTRFTEYVAKS